MCDNDHRLFVGDQVGNDIAVKEIPEFGVLVGGPFIENIDGFVFDQQMDQRDALLLPLREVQAAERIALKGYSLGQTQLFDIEIDFIAYRDRIAV